MTLPMLCVPSYSFCTILPTIHPSVSSLLSPTLSVNCSFFVVYTYYILSVPRNFSLHASPFNVYTLFVAPPLDTLMYIITSTSPPLAILINLSFLFIFSLSLLLHMAILSRLSPSSLLFSLLLYLVCPDFFRCLAGRSQIRFRVYLPPPSFTLFVHSLVFIIMSNSRPLYLFILFLCPYLTLLRSSFHFLYW